MPNPFVGYQTVVVSIQRSGNTAYLHVGNQGRNSVMIQRILLTCGGTTLFLRPPGGPGIPWVYPSAFLETGLTALYYQLNNVAPTTPVQAQAEYVEIDARSNSCCGS
jgi:hypothetical protein